MSLGLITRSGRVLTARLLKGDPIDGITHCAIGDGDETFVDPMNPPDVNVDQIALKHERARKRCHKIAFLAEDPEGVLEVNGVRYCETGSETQTIGVFFRFEEAEANGITIREYGFFGGNVEYVDGLESDYADGGVHNPATNPSGQVKTPGYLYEVKNIPDFVKTSDTRVELVGVIKI